MKLAVTSWLYMAMFFMRPSYISVASEEHGTLPRFFTFPLPPTQRSPRVNHPTEPADGESKCEAGAVNPRPSLETLNVP